MILTDEEIIKIEQTPSRSYIAHARAIEQAVLDKLQDKLKNAERYEWLRDKCTYEENPNHTWIVESPPEMWDEAIDSAMKANTVSIYDMEKTNVQN